jgi:hypothetical protein
MPRIAALLVVGFAAGVGACVFDADYTKAHVTCSDGKCPSGLACVANACVVPHQDAAVDTLVDAPPAALTCSDPGPFPASGGMTSGTTAGRANTVSSSCNGTVMTGTDAVYRIDLAAGAHATFTVTAASFPIAIYALAPCTLAPATPTCIDNSYATSGAPTTITAASAGTYFIVVDGTNAGLSGTYTFGIAVN